MHSIYKCRFSFFCQNSIVVWVLRYCVLTGIFVSCISPAYCSATSLQAIKLTCNGKSRPLGVGPSDIHFSWQIEGSGKNISQTAYQLEMEDISYPTAREGKLFWTSGKVASDQSIMVPYKGKPMVAASWYRWRVRVWDENGGVSLFSDWSVVGTGLFSEVDWKGAQWIGLEEMPDSQRIYPGLEYNSKALGTRGKTRATVPYLRTQFQSGRALVSATLFITGLGHYEVNINGKKVGNALLAPGWTHYDKRVLYNVHDVTGYIQQGANAIGMLIGNGFHYQHKERYVKLLIAYGYPKGICLLKLKYADGTEQLVKTDENWKAAPSPVTFSSLYGGEDYDGRFKHPDWNLPHFNDAKWQQAAIVKPPAGTLEAEADFPVAVREVKEAVKVVKLGNWRQVYDFGQNAAGIFEIRVRGMAGQTIRMMAAEIINTDGTVNQRATGRPSYFDYTLKGDGPEVWQPKFSYTGFRYVQVQPADTTDGTLPQIEYIKQLQIGNTTPVSGQFDCSNPLFSNTFTLINNAINSNLMSVPTDCPHREKLGWLEQTYLMGPSLHYNRNLQLLYGKLVNDMMDAQTETGLVPAIAPEFVLFTYDNGNFRDSPEWGSACIRVPWLLYEWYGDSSTFRKAYPMMKKYQQYLAGKAKGHILTHGLGDWYDLGPNPPGVSQLTPKGITATAIYYDNYNLLAKIAHQIGLVKEAKSFADKAAEVKQAFNDTFYHASQKSYATGSQTAMAMPLVLGLVPEGDERAVLKNLTDSLQANNYRLTAGDIGYYYLVKLLQDQGKDELLYSMNSRDDVPGYGFQLKNGATALTESWAALPTVSNNHFMLGHIMAWFYSGIGGIQQLQDSRGYTNLLIAPKIPGGLTYANTSFNIRQGNVISNWKISGNKLMMEVVIPGNTKATLQVPAPSGSVSRVQKTIELGSGSYQFTFDW
jgi:alpha-L-rhamnosidase